MTSATGLPALGADIQWPDAAAAAAVEQSLGSAPGRLGELASWMAGSQGSAVPTPPRAARVVLLDGRISNVTARMAQHLGVQLLPVEVPEGLDAASAAGAALADTLADEGCDLLVVTGPMPAELAAAASTVVCLIAGAEPVALLPRGAAAVDTAAWIERATRLRDGMRAVRRLREDPDALIGTLGSPVLAAASALIMHSAARRTPMLLDGPVAAAAAVLCQDVQARSGQWVHFADAHPDPVHRKAVDDLGRKPVLDLGLARDDGLAGVLAAEVVVAAVELAQDSGGGQEETR